MYVCADKKTKLIAEIQIVIRELNKRALKALLQNKAAYISIFIHT